MLYTNEVNDFDEMLRDTSQQMRRQLSEGLLMLNIVVCDDARPTHNKAVGNYGYSQIELTKFWDLHHLYNQPITDRKRAQVRGLAQSSVATRRD